MSSWGVLSTISFDALSGAIAPGADTFNEDTILVGVVNNSPLTPQELDMIMSEILGHIVPNLPELRETED